MIRRRTGRREKREKEFIDGLMVDPMNESNGLENATLTQVEKNILIKRQAPPNNKVEMTDDEMRAYYKRVESYLHTMSMMIRARRFADFRPHVAPPLRDEAPDL